MRLRGCVATIWALLAILGIGLWPEPRLAPVVDACEERTRLELAGREAIRGGAPVLRCPGHAEAGCDGCRLLAPVGAAALLLGLPIDLNLAGEAELSALPGIGPGLASRIVSDREERGPYPRLEALSRVKGLGPARVGALRGWAEARPLGVEGRPLVDEGGDRF